MKTLLCTLISLLVSATLLSSAIASEAKSKGAELINSLGCKGCHKVEGNGGTLGPSLDGVGSVLSEEELRQSLLDPKADDPNSTMPSYQHLPQEDIEALVEYLHELE